MSTDTTNQKPESGSTDCSTPIQVNLGSGLISITVFTDDNGKGIIFTDTGQKHEVGERDHTPAEPHIPHEGQVLIHCTNRESALVFMEQACRLVAMFTDE